MNNNGKINRGIDLGTTNSAIAVMENGIPTIMKSSTQKDTTPSIVSVTRKGIIHTGDTAANELANQVLRATKTWDGCTASTDAFKEFKRTMGSMEKYHSKNLQKDFNSQQLSAEIIKALAANAGIDDGGCIVISVPAKFDVTQKTATVEAARLAGFQHVELIQEPIAAAVAFGVATGQTDGFWLVFDFGGGTFDAALIRVDGGAQQVVDTEGNSFLGGKDIDYALVDSILLPYVEKNFKVSKIQASKVKSSMLREALKTYAEAAKVALSTAPNAEVLSDLGDLGCDDNGDEIELDLIVTREMAYPIMNPFFKKAVMICQKLLERNHLEGSQLTKLILVGGPTYSPYLRQMLKEEVSPNIDVSVDPMTAVAKGTALYAATRDIPTEFKAVHDVDAVEIDLYYDTMSTGLESYLALKIHDTFVMPASTTVELIRGDGAWRSGKIPYDTTGIVVDLALVPHTANNFTVRVEDGLGHNIKVSPSNLTILQGLQVSAAPLPYHIGFGVWNEKLKRQEFLPFIGLEKGKPVPAYGVTHSRKTTMSLVPGDKNTYLRIPVYQASSCVKNSPAMLHEHVADLFITGEDVVEEIAAGSEVEVKVEVNNSELMRFVVTIMESDEDIIKELDTSPRFNAKDADKLIAELTESARQTLDMLAAEKVAVDVLKNRLYDLKFNQRHTEKKAIVDQYKELLRDIYRLECDTAWERVWHKVEMEIARLTILEWEHRTDFSQKAIENLNESIANAKQNRDVAAAERILYEIEMIQAALVFDTNAPKRIKWYDKNFDNISWFNKEDARRYVDAALKLLECKYSKDELLDAFQLIINEKNENEIHEAEGLLG